MKALVAVVFVLGIVAGREVLADGVQINQDSVVFLYEARAEVRVPEHKLAEIISGDYRAAQDEFTRHELMESIKPVIERRLKEAKDSGMVFMRTRSQLGDYDFDKAGFPTGVGEGSYWRVRRGRMPEYVVMFENGEELGFLPVPVEAARSLAGDLRVGRGVVLAVYGEIVSVREESVQYIPSKVLEVRANMLEVRLEHGSERLVGRMEVVGDGSSDSEEVITTLSCRDQEDRCTDTFITCSANCGRGNAECETGCTERWRACRGRIDC